MEFLLTPIVNRLLQRYIKSVDGESSSNLRVSLSGGSVILSDLELNIDPLLQHLPIRENVRVVRAYGKTLSINLATSPIQVQCKPTIDGLYT